MGYGCDKVKVAGGVMWKGRSRSVEVEEEEEQVVVLKRRRRKKRGSRKRRK